MPISDWFDLMPSSVTIENVATRDSYGKVLTYSAGQTLRCHFSSKFKVVKSMTTGEDIVSTGTAWCGGLFTGLGPDTRVTVNGSSIYILVSYGSSEDEDGDLYTTLYVGPV